MNFKSIGIDVFIISSIGTLAIVGMDILIKSIYDIYIIPRAVIIIEFIASFVVFVGA